MSKLHRTLRAALIFFAGLGALGLVPVGAEEPAAAKVDIITVQAKQEQTAVSVGGTVVAHKSVTLAAQTPGRVEYIAGEEGDRFAAGAQLLTLDDDALLAQLRAAQAQQAAAESTLRNAGVQLHREIASPSSSTGAMGGMPMFGSMMNPMDTLMGGTRNRRVERHSDIHARRTQVEQARTSLMQAQSQIKEVHARLRDTKSVAPFEGVIAKKYVETGDTTQPGQPLLEFSDTRSLQIQVDVPLRLKPALREGLEVSARLDVSKNRIPARVARIFPVADVERHTVRVKLDLPKDVPAAAGMYAEVLIPEPTARAASQIAIPNASVVWKGGLPLVFVVNDEGRAQLRMVRVGDPINEEEVAILAGLKSGDRLVARPTPGMSSGTLVAP